MVKHEFQHTALVTFRLMFGNHTNVFPHAVIAGN